MDASPFYLHFTIFQKKNPAISLFYSNNSVYAARLLKVFLKSLSYWTNPPESIHSFLQVSYISFFPCRLHPWSNHQIHRAQEQECQTEPDPPHVLQPGWHLRDGWRSGPDVGVVLQPTERPLPHGADPAGTGAAIRALGRHWQQECQAERRLFVELLQHAEELHFWLWSTRRWVGNMFPCALGD